MIIDRIKNYDKSHCWQYDIRLNNLIEDMKINNITHEQMKCMRVKDFKFIEVTDKKERKNLTKFIERHEWLGTISQYTTHWFGAYYNGILAGVILMSMPNSFSKIVGDETKKLERLVSRGACISWSLKNLASSFLMWTIRYMVKNTNYRVFTAYSDPMAKELGIIYQATNWLYLGKKSGTTKRYVNPYTGKLISDRAFRTRSFYKKYAKELNIEWDKSWNSDQKILWDLIPDEIEHLLREMGREKQRNAEYYEFPHKHKYVYILGIDKREHKELMNKITVKIYDYPKDRGY